MKKYIAALFILLVTITSLACSMQLELDELLPNTKPVAQTEDIIEFTSGLLPDYSVDDIIGLADVIMTGTVTDILPAQMGTRINSGTQVMFTDVILKPEEILFGDIGLDPITIRVWGGRINNNVGISEYEPVFALNEDVLVFVKEYSEISSNTGERASSYYRVRGNFLGKYRGIGNDWIRADGNKVKLDTIERSIQSIYSTEP